MFPNLYNCTTSILKVVLYFPGDDGEVFQVKKSSHSKKIKKILEKEKKKKKDDTQSVEIMDINDTTKEITFSNELTIKIKNNLVSFAKLIIIMNSYEVT